LAVSGSLQAGSSNRSLLESAASLAPEGVEVVFFEGLRALPHFDPDLERDAPRPEVEAWRRALSESDAVLVASPEYGHSLPGSLKNAIDWVIGTGQLYRKVVAITASVSYAERGRMGLQALRQTLEAVSAIVAFDAPIVKGPDADGEITALLRQIARAVEAARRDE